MIGWRDIAASSRALTMLGLVPPLAALAIQWTFSDLIHPHVWFLFYPAVFLSSWIGGRRSGLLATVVSTVLAWWLFVPPPHVLANPKQFFPAAVFFATGVLFALFHHRLRQANDTLRRVNEERRIFAALVDNSSDFIGIADASGTPVYVNPAGRRMVELGPDRPVQDTTIPEYYPAELHSFVSDVIVKAVLEKGHWRGETYFRNWRTNEPIPVSDEHFVIRATNGRILGMGTVTRDISDIKRARDEIEAANRKLKELDDLKTQFFASASHELRTPLALIIGPTDRLLASARSDADRHDLDVIARNARTMLRHVNDLLDVAKLEAGRMKADYAEIDLAALARFIAGHFDSIALEKNVSYALDIPDGVRVQIDSDKVRRILFNLLSNAFKFTPSGGRIRLAVREDGNRVRIEVADSGPGIPADKREMIFERFHQLEGTLGGTGLGLAIAREFATLHGGTIAVGDAPEGGSLLVVELPKHAPPGTELSTAIPFSVEDARSVTDVPARSDGALILVVEDNHDMNRFICESLAKDYRIAAAFDGEEGLRKAVDLTPDLIVSDMMMPKMGGAELVREARKHAALSRTPIILVTAKTEDDLRVELLRHGAQDWLTKPFSVDELRVRVENLVARKQAEDALRLSEAKASGIVSVSPDAIVCIDEHQRITLFNEGAEAIFGYSQSEAIGAPLDMLIPERFREVHRREVEAFATAAETSRHMGRRDSAICGRRKNGDVFPADAAISKLEVGGKKMFTVALRDVTERKRIESEQRLLAEIGPVLAATLDYEKTLSTIADLAVQSLANVCFVDLVAEGGEIRRLRVVSDDPSKAALCEGLMKFAPSKVVRDALDTKKLVLVEHFTDAMIPALGRVEEHLELIRAFRPKSIMSVPLVARGNLLGAISFVSTVEGRAYGEHDTRLAQELANRAALAVENARLYSAALRAIEARDEVLSVVAHDLRNPLNGIVLQSQLLKRRDGPERRSTESADAIRKAAHRMNRLIQDLLDVARMDAGHLTLDRTVLGAAQLVRDSAAAQAAIVSSAGLELGTDVAADLPAIAADRERLLQVFENLVGNAIKFTRKGGHVTLGATRRGDDVVFRVADDGVGMSAEEIPHAFDRFWQAKKRDRRGAGLGLSIVKGIVEAHGGRIWIESSGKGTTFSFAIPTSTSKVDQRADEPLEDVRQRVHQ